MVPDPAAITGWVSNTVLGEFVTWLTLVTTTVVGAGVLVVVISVV